MSGHNAFMPLYPGDYQRDTAHLSCEQHGAYLLLLMHAWTHDGLVPDDDDQLARITHMERRPWAKIRLVVLAFFYPTEGGYRQKRMDREIAKRQATVAEIDKRREGTAERTRRWRSSQAANPPPRQNGQDPPGDASRDAHVTRHTPVTEPSQPTSQPPSRDAHPVPVPVPVPVPGKGREILKNPSFSPETRARGSREQRPVADGLAELLADAGISPPKTSEDLVGERQPDEPLPEPFAVHARRAAKALTMSIPYGEVRSVEAQLDALREQPRVVGADEAMGLRWQPAEPVRDVQAQIQAMLEGCSPDQIAKAKARVMA